jgi:hypothetical protein
MPEARNNQTGTSSPPSATASRDGGHRHLGHGRRRRSGSAPHGPPDVGALAREAVISFLNDASKATAEREAARAGMAATEVGAAVTAAAPEPEAMPRDAISAPSHGTAELAAWRAAAISAAALDRIEAAAAKVEADIAVAHRAYTELQAGAGAAAEAAVNAAKTAMAAAGTAVEAERQVRISLRQVRQNVVISFALVVIVIIVLEVISPSVH